MQDFAAQNGIIRQFLLGELSEEEAEQLEERVFTEPDFAQEVRMVEEELMSDYLAGSLSSEARGLFEHKYESTLANQRELEYARALNTFIPSTPARIAAMQPRDSVPAQSDPTHNANRSLIPQARHKRVSGISLVYAFVSSHRALAYSALMVVLLLLTTGLWYRFRQPPAGRGDSYAAERRLREKELAGLNTDSTASLGPDLVSVELQPAQRNGVEILRIIKNPAAKDGLLKFRLNLMQDRQGRYSATFLDDKHKELFTVPQLTAQTTPNGPQIGIVVPLKYLEPGDYQIELSVSGKNSIHEEVNSYPFRVVKSK